MEILIRFPCDYLGTVNWSIESVIFVSYLFLLNTIVKKDKASHSLWCEVCVNRSAYPCLFNKLSHYGNIAFHIEMPQFPNASGQILCVSIMVQHQFSVFPIYFYIYCVYVLINEKAPVIKSTNAIVLSWNFAPMEFHSLNHGGCFTVF